MARNPSNPSRTSRRRCLIVERYEWDTGVRRQQLQFVLDTAQQFFGTGDRDREIQVRVFLPPQAAQPAIVREITISREYANGTRRVNGFPDMESLPSSFIFFEETDQPGVYDLWWQQDRAIVAAWYTGWSQGKNSQLGRGRLSVIVDAPVPRPIDRIM